MSYHPPPPPAQGYPPYGSPAPQGYPNQAPPPQQQQYGQPAPYGQAHSPYPPAQQAYHAPPPPQHTQQSQGAQGYYGGPPQAHQQAPYPPPPHAAAAQHAYGAPQQYPPQGHQQAQYGAPPGQQQQWGAQFPPALPSPGYGPLNIPPIDCAPAADQLRGAMKGIGTRESALIQVLAQFPAAHMEGLRAAYQQRHRRSLESDLADETSGHFRETLLAIVRGPLLQDAHALNDAIRGLGTKEQVINDVLICRSNADLNAIKRVYQSTYQRSLEKDISDDLSMKTDRLFSMILAATRQEESTPMNPQAIEHDVSELHRATEGTRLGTDQLTVCSILSNRSDGTLRAITAAYEAKYRKPLEKVLASEFGGHMKTALVQIVRAANDRAMRDAVLLEDCMAGPGTKDDLLVSRLVACHWNREHMGQVRGAYKHRFKKDLVQRIKGETSKDYEKILVAMVEG